MGIKKKMKLCECFNLGWKIAEKHFKFCKEEMKKK